MSDAFQSPHTPGPVARGISLGERVQQLQKDAIAVGAAATDGWCPDSVGRAG